MTLPSAQVYFFTGSHTYKLENALKGWVTQFEEKHGNYNLSRIDVAASETTMAELRQHLSAPPFLSEKRLVVLKNFPFQAEKKFSKEKEEKETYLLEAIKTLPETTICVLFSEKPDMRRKAAKELEKSTTLRRMEWNDFEKEEMIYEKVGKVTSAALRKFLFDYLGNDPIRIASELEKLQMFAGGEQLTREIIEELAIPALEESVFSLLDAATGKNPKRALQLLEKLLLMWEDIFAVLNMLIWQYEQLFYVKELSSLKKSDGEIMEITGQKPYSLQKNKQMLPRHSMESLSKSIELLYDFDVRIKTGAIKTTQEDQKSFEGAVTELILSLCML